MKELAIKANELVEVIREDYITTNGCEPTLNEVYEIAIADAYYKDLGERVHDKGII